MKGQIIKISSDLHFISCENEIYPCKCRGIFRKEHITPVVGDYVLFSKEKSLIEEVLPRKNVFERPKVSNIDQAFLITSLRLPDFSTNLLDKFISLMEMNHVEPIICITKRDLMNQYELNKIDEILSYYKKIGYKVIYNTELDKIKELLRDKTSVFTGQTGAGKSTLLNKLNPDWNLETGEVSLALGRGKHTTRVVELFEISNGKVMDTPGFSSLEFKNYTKEDIKNSFIEFSEYPCPFRDCSHTNEKECVVKQQVLANNILESRYLNYLNFIGADINEKN
ncbi:MAG: ribosome small subunit-dependent GTPase A [Bacilli bacterium]|nr:ribosome small subunit-dependent GTPase A [Bacilli bacterium]